MISRGRPSYLPRHLDRTPPLSRRRLLPRSCRAPPHCHPRLCCRYESFHCGGSVGCLPVRAFSIPWLYVMVSQLAHSREHCHLRFQFSDCVPNLDPMNYRARPRLPSASARGLLAPSRPGLWYADRTHSLLNFDIGAARVSVLPGSAASGMCGSCGPARHSKGHVLAAHIVYLSRPGDPYRLGMSFDPGGVIRAWLSLPSSLFTSASLPLEAPWHLRNFQAAVGYLYSTTSCLSHGVKLPHPA